jgi:hypothetical protein
LSEAGAAGSGDWGVTDTGADAVDDPPTFTAVTVYVYDVPFVSPTKVAVAAWVVATMTEPRLTR